MNTYTIFWNDGTSELIRGKNFELAFRAKYSQVTSLMVNSVATGDVRKDYEFTGSKWILKR